ncbi:MAG TPA: hypothetical protein VIV61_07490 [Candidatus Ozemobacteraceae bacterium]
MNRYPTVVYCVLLSMLVACGAAIACELPAEPAAAVVPDINDQNFSKVKIVEENGGFYFLVPENTQLKMRIVWDPYDHNGGKLDEKYDYVARADKGNIPPDPNAPVINGKAYFPLSAMTKFFDVSGNRKSVTEAFSRSNGNIAENTFIEDKTHMGPALLLTNAFVKPGQDGAVTILETEHAAAYGSSSALVNLEAKTYEELSELDKVLPNDSADFADKIKPQPTEVPDPPTGYLTQVKYLFGKAGIQMDNLDVKLTQIENKDYKAYIVAGEPNVWSDGTLPVVPDGDPDDKGVGNDSGEVTATFHTPNVGATVPTKVKVKAPAAGFEVTNLYWCWEEEITVTVASDTNGDGTMDAYIMAPGDPKCGVTVAKCSAGLKVVIKKPSNSSGFSAFRVYNTRSPIASKLEVLSNPVFTCGAASMSVPFRLTTWGTDPFADKEINPPLTAKDGSEIKHDIEAMKSSIKLYMSYPVYSFAKSPDITVDDLANMQKVNLGLLEFVDAKLPKWNGTYYHQNWTWIPASSTTITSAVLNKLEADGATTFGGGSWVIEGTALFDVPAPQHFDNEGDSVSTPYAAHGANYPATGTPDVEKLLKFFAITRDSAGHKSASYDAIDALASATTAMQTFDSAGKALDKVVLPDTEAEVGTLYDHQPPLKTRIPNDIPSTSAGTLSTYTWQLYQYLKCDDQDTPPEIQVIVFDTRNNRYHIFGSKAGGDAKIAGSAPSFAAYQTASPSVYSEDDIKAITDSLKFTQYEPTLFDRFIDKDGIGGASTLSEPALAGKGFVCQENTRLLFYIRAWDNINTFSEADTFGVSQISYEVKDWFATSSDRPPSSGYITYDPDELMSKPIVWLFRAPNVNSAGAEETDKECSITVKAKDKAGAEQVLTLKVFVHSNDLTIRSLEEKRRRN